MNISLLSDFYEFTMANGYYQMGFENKKTFFDLYFRKVPDSGGFAIAVGLDNLIDYIQNLRFEKEDIEFLRAKNIFGDDFLDYLADFRFKGDIYAVPEGTPVFPGEPIVTVQAPAIDAQIIETAALLLINHQSLIATKANRIVRASGGRAVMEFGARRAQGNAAATLGARAAYIAGCAGTSNTLSDKLYGIPALGTMAHSWVQMFDSEYEAFETYCKIYPHNTVLLVDTYDTIKSGIPNAIKAIKNILVPQGVENYAIRLDSGDIAYLSKEARKILDDAGLPNCRIVASNSLDEYLIRDLLMQGAKIDSFGVGERLITAKSSPVFGGVYKLVAVQDEGGEIVPKIKLSENITKITTPHFKKLHRLYSTETGKALADLICVHDEVIDDTKPLEIFDPVATWKRKTLTHFTAKELLAPIFKNGKLVYDRPDIEEIRNYCREEVDRLWDEVKRFENPHKYYVDLSQRLWDIKNKMLERPAER